MPSSWHGIILAEMQGASHNLSGSAGLSSRSKEAASYAETVEIGAMSCKQRRTQEPRVACAESSSSFPRRSNPCRFPVATSLSTSHVASDVRSTSISIGDVDNKECGRPPLHNEYLLPASSSMKTADSLPQVTVKTGHTDKMNLPSLSEWSGPTPLPPLSVLASTHPPFWHAVGEGNSRNTTQAGKRTSNEGIMGAKHDAMCKLPNPSTLISTTASVSPPSLGSEPKYSTPFWNGKSEITQAGPKMSMQPIQPQMQKDLYPFTEFIQAYTKQDGQSLRPGGTSENSSSVVRGTEERRMPLPDSTLNRGPAWRLDTHDPDLHQAHPCKDLPYSTSSFYPSHQTSPSQWSQLPVPRHPSSVGDAMDSIDRTDGTVNREKTDKLRTMPNRNVDEDKQLGSHFRDDKNQNVLAPNVIFQSSGHISSRARQLWKHGGGAYPAGFSSAIDTGAGTPMRYPELLRAQVGVSPPIEHSVSGAQQSQTRLKGLDSRRVKCSQSQGTVSSSIEQRNISSTSQKSNDQAYRECSKNFANIVNIERLSSPQFLNEMEIFAGQPVASKGSAEGSSKKKLCGTSLQTSGPHKFTFQAQPRGSSVEGKALATRPELATEGGYCSNSTKELTHQGNSVLPQTNRGDIQFVAKSEESKEPVLKRFRISPESSLHFQSPNQAPFDRQDCFNCTNEERERRAFQSQSCAPGELGAENVNRTSHMHDQRYFPTQQPIPPETTYQYAQNSSDLHKISSTTAADKEQFSCSRILWLPAPQPATAMPNILGVPQSQHEWTVSGLHQKQVCGPESTAQDVLDSWNTQYGHESVLAEDKVPQQAIVGPCSGATVAQTPTESRVRRGTHVCNQCGYAANQSSDLKRHQATHQDLRPFPCDSCGCAFRQKAHLNAHKRAIHNRLRPYQCDLCNREFAARSSLKRHVTYVHGRNPPFRCSICAATFSHVWDLNCHRAEAHPDGVTHTNPSILQHTASLRPANCDEVAVPRNRSYSHLRSSGNYGVVPSQQSILQPSCSQVEGTQGWSTGPHDQRETCSDTNNANIGNLQSLASLRMSQRRPPSTVCSPWPSSCVQGADPLPRSSVYPSTSCCTSSLLPGNTNLSFNANQNLPGYERQLATISPHMPVGALDISPLIPTSTGRPLTMPGVPDSLQLAANQVLPHAQSDPENYSRNVGMLVSPETAIGSSGPVCSRTPRISSQSLAQNIDSLKRWQSK